MKTLFGRKAYAVLLLAYPKEFRREYGPQMVQLLRDCERDAPTFLALIGLWIRTLSDFLRTVPAEHMQHLRKEKELMSKPRTDLVAIGGCLLLIVLAVLLLNFGRSHQISAILTFGYVLDAIAFTGIAGNVIVFLLARFTALRPLSIAFWTFLFVCGVTAIAITLLVGRVDPNFSASNVLIGYVVSFFFWYGLHWLWIQKLKASATT
jgi:hypothetical protein